ncbi:hypothetical protein [Paenibacillus sanfengchensis]|uniref:hypothetical protein n=1 Tax=Paenibacillus sanfengchensis TaxID=3119819 RepID=UPI002FE1B306
MSKYTYVKIVSGLPVKYPENELQLFFDEEFLNVVEGRKSGHKWVVENIFKIPLKNIIAASAEVVRKDYYVEEESAKTTFHKGFFEDYAVTKKQTDVKKKTGWIFPYNISFINSQGEVALAQFFSLDGREGMTREFNKKLEQKLLLIPKSPEVLGFYKFMYEELNKSKERII